MSSIFYPFCEVAAFDGVKALCDRIRIDPEVVARKMVETVDAGQFATVLVDPFNEFEAGMLITAKAPGSVALCIMRGDLATQDEPSARALVQRMKGDPLLAGQLVGFIELCRTGVLQ
jgi:hypothetical protein